MKSKKASSKIVSSMGQRMNSFDSKDSLGMYANISLTDFLHVYCVYLGLLYTSVIVLIFFVCATWLYSFCTNLSFSYLNFQKSRKKNLLSFKWLCNICLNIRVFL